MKIKTYSAPQLAEALAMIKKELGEEALILSTKEVELRGRNGSFASKGYEVVAASDTTDQSLPEPASRERDAAPPITAAARNAYRTPLSRRKPLTAPGPSAPSVPPASPAPEPHAAVAPRETLRTAPEKPAAPVKAAKETDDVPLNDLFRRELQELKRMVRWSAQSVPGARMRISDQDADALYVELIANDLDESLARRIIAEAQDRARMGGSRSLEDLVRQVMREMITVQPLAEKSSSRVVAAFLGPTGVGKTTTIAKLASRFALELGKRTLLITMDTYRIGAAEQLKIYAELIGLPILVVSSVAELDQALRDHEDMQVVLIDTVGRAHNRLEQMSELADYLRAAAGIEKHLVLSLTTKPLDLHEIINSFQVFGINKLLFTKLDETLTSGASANELVRTRLPLSYLTTGQNVPQDIQIPTASSFVELIIAREISEEVRQAYA